FRIIWHQLFGAEGDDLRTRARLNPYETRWPTKLKDPIHTTSARRESYSLGHDHNGGQFNPTSRDHRRNRVHLRMHIVTAESMLDVTAHENSTVTGKRRRSYSGIPQDVSMAPHLPSGFRHINQSLLPLLPVI